MNGRRTFSLALAAAVLAAAAARPAEPEGPWYFVPVHEAEIEATRTTTTSATFHAVDAGAVPDGTAWDTVRALLERLGPCVAYDVAAATTVDGRFSLVPVADAAVGRVPLSTGRSAWADFDGTVALTPHGFLAGVNVSSEGRGPAAVRAAAATVARLAALAVLARAAGPDDPVRRILEELRRDPGAFLDGSLACSHRPLHPAASPDQVAALPPGEIVEAECPPFGEALGGVPAATRWAVGSSRRACAALRALRRQAELVDTIRDGLHGLLASEPGPDDPNGLRYERRFQALSASYQSEYPKLAGLAGALGEAVGEALSAPEVSGRKVTVERARMPLDDLCSASRMAAPDGRDRCPRAWSLLDAAGVALAGEPAVPVPAAPPGPAAVSERLGRTRRSAHTFFFRQPVPERFQLLRCTAAAAEGGRRRCTAFAAEEPVTEWVLHPRTGLGSLTLEQKAFRSGSLAISFSELGVPATLTVRSAAGAAGLAEAVADATAALRDEYRESLHALVDIEATRRELGLDALDDEIARLEKERERREAAAALETSSLAAAMAQAQATAELTAARTRLDAELAHEVTAARAADRALAVRLAELEQAVALLERQLAAGR